MCLITKKKKIGYKFKWDYKVIKKEKRANIFFSNMGMIIFWINMRVTLKFLKQEQTICAKKSQKRPFMSVHDILWQQLKFSYWRINFERKENGVDMRAILRYHFRWF